MSTEPLVYILILNWKAYKDTARCADACRKLTYPNFRILILDNRSPDRSGIKLYETFPDLEYIQTGANLGYAGGNNVGIRHAIKQGAAFVWILNPDVIPEPASLDTMVQEMKQAPSVGIMGPRILQNHPPSVFCFEGISIAPKEGYQIRFNMVDKEHDQASGLREVDTVSGCSMLVRGGLLRHIGLMREDFFLYYEETELCYRAREHNWQTVICPRARVSHRLHNPFRQPLPYPYIERSFILFARTQKKYIFRTILVVLNMTQIKQHFNKKGLRPAFRLSLRRMRGILSGLLTPFKPIPRV